MRPHTIMRLLALAGVLGLLPGPGPVFAQQKKLALEQLTERADIVAVGTVSGLSSAWNAERTRITTEVTIQVDQTLKGTPGGLLTLTIPGGEVGDAGELYSHVPRFQREEQVVVFAARDNSGRYRIAGGEQGKIGITREDRSGRLLVSTGEVLEAFTTRVRRAAAAAPQR
jgi:hypothetical protein